MAVLKRQDLLYPELSYKIVGSLYGVYNLLGPGLPEKYYQKALAEELALRGILFNRELRYAIKYRNRIIGSGYLDFLIDQKIILEIKKGPSFSKGHIDQVLAYLRATNLKLAILANFSSQGIMFKRIINIK